MTRNDAAELRNILLFIFRNSIATVVVPLELSSEEEENKLHMSHLRLAEWNNVSCFSLTESLCHGKLWRWTRRQRARISNGNVFWRQARLTANDRSMMDVPGLGFMGFATEPETE